MNSIFELELLLKLYDLLFEISSAGISILGTSIVIKGFTLSFDIYGFSLSSEIYGILNLRLSSELYD